MISPPLFYCVVSTNLPNWFRDNAAFLTDGRANIRQHARQAVPSERVRVSQVSTHLVQVPGTARGAAFISRSMRSLLCSSAVRSRFSFSCALRLLPAAFCAHCCHPCRAPLRNPNRLPAMPRLTGRRFLCVSSHSHEKNPRLAALSIQPAGRLLEKRESTPTYHTQLSQ